MKRRRFIESIALSGGLLSGFHPYSTTTEIRKIKSFPENENEELSRDVAIAGGGMGGCAAALAALRNGLNVVMTEETQWIGGQLTQQGLSCPDEHEWIENYGAPQSYRDFRNAVRNYYKSYYPLTDSAQKKKYLNPGDGSVSRLCHEPKISLAILYELLNPYLSSGKLIILLQHKIIKADVEGDSVKYLIAESLKTKETIILQASYFVDATELGDLLPLTNMEYVTGSESQKETNELHAPTEANPKENQAFTYCFAMDYEEGRHTLINKPEEYEFWRDYVPKMEPSWSGRLLNLSYSSPRTLEKKELGFDPRGNPTGDWLNLWNYRKIINPDNFKPGFFSGGISMVNWPQNDFFPGNLIDVPQEEFDKYIKQSKQLSLSLLYWLQTEAPRADGKQGWPGLRLRKDMMGTEDGLAMYPYIRESRRIKAVFTVLEEHVGKENRARVMGNSFDNKSADFYDSVGIGYYHIDLHPSSTGRNYIDFSSMPFQIPLGALLPIRMKNLFPANKNIGTTHITNGCYRLHPVEWSIGEAVGLLMSYALDKKIGPHEVRENRETLRDFQKFIESQGIDIRWPK